MQSTSYLVPESCGEPRAAVKKTAMQHARSNRRRLNAIYKAKRRRFTMQAGAAFHTFPLIIRTKKILISAGLSISSASQILLRYFYYLVIFGYRFISWVSLPLIRAYQTAVPLLREKYEDFILWKDSFSHSPMGRLPAVAMIGAFTALILSVNYFGLGLEVYIDGEPVGFVSSEDEIVSAIRSVENRSAFYLNHPYNLTIDVDYKLKLMDSSDIINPYDLEEMLFSNVTEISTLYVLSVDGNIIGANESKTAIEMVLDKILDPYRSDDPNVRTEFVQDVSISEMPVANVYLKSAPELTAVLKGEAPAETAAVSSMTQTVEKPKTYIVQSGDTASGIASKSSLKLSELKALNPTLNPDKLSIGQEINLGTASVSSAAGTASSSSPVLSVKQIKQISYIEKIPFETITEKSASLYKNNKKTKVAGKQGEASVSAEVVMIDGEEVSRTITNRIILSDPVTQIVQVGTKEPPPKSPTGKFMYPFRGLVTSNYGYRGREFHTGVDFAGPVGSRIVAADGGKVVFAGRKGNYGKCIIISHGNGLETLYAHCSSLVVSSGQQVGKGELIARVGSTGRSTGPHLHFEVRVRGNYVNPWKYLK